MILNFASNAMENDKKTTVDVLKAIAKSVDNLAVTTYAEDYGFRCPLYREVTIDIEKSAQAASSLRNHGVIVLDSRSSGDRVL